MARLIIFQGFRHPLLDLLDALGVGGVVAEDGAAAVGGGGSHALPESGGNTRVVASHGGENQSDMVGLALLTA